MAQMQRRLFNHRIANDSRALCHPKRDGYCQGLCSSCYYKRLRKENPEMQRRFYLKSHYGLTVEAYESLVAKQNGLCAICKNKSRVSVSHPLYIDHCHKTGQVRGLLCNVCNSMVGYLEKHGHLIPSAIQYLADTGTPLPSDNGRFHRL